MLKEAFNKEKSNEQDAGDTFRDIREDAVGTYQTTTEKMEGRPTVFTLLDLPLELLLRVLALLDEQELMTARLVCRDWRKASLTFMTHLNLNAWLQNVGSRTAPATCEALASCLTVLPNLSNLSYCIESPDDASLLSVPSCSSLLRELSIDFSFPSWPFNASGSRDLIIAAAMAPIARLTGLTNFSADDPSWWSPADKAAHAQFVLSSGLILTHCTSLCEVYLLVCEVETWLLLLPLLAGLPHLRVLGDLFLCNQELVARVACMTQLTHVEGSDDGSEELHLQPLLHLPALRALAITIYHVRNWPALMCATTQGMVQLSHLVISLHDPASAVSWGAVLSPLSRLTRLELDALSPLPHHLWQPCLENMQDLRWFSASEAGGGAALPLSLHHLDLELRLLDGSEMPRLVQRVAALTRLTWLSLSVGSPAYGWTTDSRANALWRSASFLTGLTRLIHLDLDHVLHAGNVEGDVECLAVLTGLRSLCLRGSCDCHGGAEHDVLLELGIVPEESDGWTAGPCGFEAFQRRGGFLQLLPLAGVKILATEGPWEVLKESKFESQVNAVRRVAGRPPLKFQSNFQDGLLSSTSVVVALQKNRSLETLGRPDDLS